MIFGTILTVTEPVNKSPIRVLVVDDHEHCRRYFSRTLQEQLKFQVIAEASDGLEAVRLALDLQPDLILLDIGMPTLNGIQAAVKIRELSLSSKILFLSEIRSLDVVDKALSTGAGGYVVKSDAATELLPAVQAVLQGRQFVSRSLAGHDFSNRSNDLTVLAVPKIETPWPLLENIETAYQHVAAFYSDDQRLLNEMTQFVGAALKKGNGAVVVATELHRRNLLPRLQSSGLDVDAAVEQGRYIALDAAETLQSVMVNDSPNPVRFLELFGDLIVMAAEAANSAHPRVAVFGECVQLLWAQGNVEAAIQMEKLGNQLIKIHSVDILCGYSPGIVAGGMDDDIFQRICAEHSAVYSL